MSQSAHSLIRRKERPLTSARTRKPRPQFGKDLRNLQLQVRVTEQCRHRVEELALLTNKPLNRVVEDAVNHYHDAMLTPEETITNG
jgi:hypothetical protein